MSSDTCTYTEITIGTWGITAVALNDRAVWSRSCHPPGAFHSSRDAEFGVELEWKAPDGLYERDQTASSMIKPSAMRDGCSRTSDARSGLNMPVKWGL